MDSYILLRYTYKYYCQGTEEHSTDYALVDIPPYQWDDSFQYAKDRLLSKRYITDEYEIDADSITDMTIL